MDCEKPYESFIKRTTPEVPINIKVGRQVLRVVLRYDNTIVYTHSEEYDMFDHVFMYGDYLPNEGVAAFRDPDGDFELGQRLLEMGYDNYDRTYPSLDDEERWFRWQCRDIEDYHQ